MRLTLSFLLIFVAAPALADMFPADEATMEMGAYGASCTAIHPDGQGGSISFTTNAYANTLQAARDLAADNVLHDCAHAMGTRRTRSYFRRFGAHSHGHGPFPHGGGRLPPGWEKTLPPCPPPYPPYPKVAGCPYDPTPRPSYPPGPSCKITQCQAI